jgi:hypothetical protein
MFHVKRRLVHENKTRIVLESVIPTPSTSLRRLRGMTPAQKFFCEELPRPFEGRGRASGAGEGQKFQDALQAYTLSHRERIEGEGPCTARDFPARDSTVAGLLTEPLLVFCVIPTEAEGPRITSMVRLVRQQ